jgi:hypothetical protein
VFNLITRVAARANLQVIQVAAAQGIAGGNTSGGNPTLQVTPRRDRRASGPGSAHPTTLNDSDACWAPTGWKFGPKPDRNLGETTAAGAGK